MPDVEGGLRPASSVNHSLPVRVSLEALRPVHSNISTPGDHPVVSREEEERGTSPCMEEV